MAVIVRRRKIRPSTRKSTSVNYRVDIAKYAQDLKMYPKNGWALKGLSLAYLKLGDESNHKATVKQFKEAWKTADVILQ